VRTAGRLGRLLLSDANSTINLYRQVRQVVNRAQAIAYLPWPGFGRRDYADDGCTRLRADFPDVQIGQLHALHDSQLATDFFGKRFVGAIE